MDRRERYHDPIEAIRLAMSDKQTRLWTALPGLFEAVDFAQMTASVQPAVKGRIADARGQISEPALPLLVDVPIVFPHGGGVSLTFPLKPGDECLIVLACRCIDGWWSQGGVQPAMDLRMHDLSDGFAIPGPWSQPRRPQPASAAEAQLRTDDGLVVIGVGPGHASITAPQLTINAPNAVFNGSITATGDVTAGAVSLRGHVHGGVARGGALTDPALAQPSHDPAG